MRIALTVYAAFLRTGDDEARQFGLPLAAPETKLGPEAVRGVATLRAPAEAAIALDSGDGAAQRAMTSLMRWLSCLSLIHI